MEPSLVPALYLLGVSAHAFRQNPVLLACYTADQVSNPQSIARPRSTPRRIVAPRRKRAHGFSACHNISCCFPNDVCLENGSCCTPITCGSEPPASLYGCGSGSDGCGGTINCTCPQNWLCIARDSGNLCANLTNECIPGITADSFGDIGLCAQTAGFCATSASSETTQCVSLSQAMCIDCTQDLEFGAISGDVCVQSWSAVCPTQFMCAQAL